LPDQWKESIIVPIYHKDDETDYSKCRGISLLSTSYNIVFNILLSSLSPYMDEIIGINSVVFDTRDQLLIRFLHSSVAGGKKGVQ
jgi:hypothetical protein